MTSDTQLLVALDGRRLLDAAGHLLAELGENERWYTPDGLPCQGLAIPAARPAPYINPDERAAAQRAGDRAWMTSALATIARLAATVPTITSDDVWTAVEQPPRESRLIGNAMLRAQSVGLIEATDQHRRSKRSMNHHRPIRVWRSLDRRQPELA